MNNPPPSTDYVCVKEFVELNYRQFGCEQKQLFLYFVNYIFAMKEATQMDNIALSLI